MFSGELHDIQLSKINFNNQLECLLVFPASAAATGGALRFRLSLDLSFTSKKENIVNKVKDNIFQ